MEGSRIDCDPPSPALLREVARDIESNSLCKWRFTGISVFHQIIDDVVTAAMRCRGFHVDCVSKDEHEEQLDGLKDEVSHADGLITEANNQITKLEYENKIMKLRLAVERESKDEGT